MGLTNEETAELRALRASKAAVEADRALRILRADVNYALSGDPKVLQQRLEVALRESVRRYS